jgi:hypothetical protein
MSNRIGITDIVNRLESDMLLLTKQELYWQAKVMLHNFREKISDLEELNPAPRVKEIDYIFDQLNGFLQAEEKNLEDTVIE